MSMLDNKIFFQTNKTKPYEKDEVDFSKLSDMRCGKIVCTQEEFESLLFDVVIEAKMVGMDIQESKDGYADESNMEEAINKLKEKIIWES